MCAFSGKIPPTKTLTFDVFDFDLSNWFVRNAEQSNIESFGRSTNQIHLPLLVLVNWSSFLKVIFHWIHPFQCYLNYPDATIHGININSAWHSFVFDFNLIQTTRPFKLFRIQGLCWQRYVGSVSKFRWTRSFTNIKREKGREWKFTMILLFDFPVQCKTKNTDENHLYIVSITFQWAQMCT